MTMEITFSNGVDSILMQTESNHPNVPTLLSGFSGLGVAERSNNWLASGGNGRFWAGQRVEGGGHTMRVLFQHSTKELLEAQINLFISVIRSKPFTMAINDGTTIWEDSAYLGDGGQFQWGEDHNIHKTHIVLTFSIERPYPYLRARDNVGVFIVPMPVTRPNGPGDYILQTEAVVPPPNAAAIADNRIIYTGGGNMVNHRITMPGNAPSNFALHLLGPFDSFHIRTDEHEFDYNHALGVGERRVLDFGWQEIYNPVGRENAFWEIVGQPMNLTLRNGQPFVVTFVNPSLPTASGSDWLIQTHAYLDTNPAKELWV